MMITFADLVGPPATIRKLFDGLQWAEGPVWVAHDRRLLVSDIPANRILSWTPEAGVSTYRSDSNRANGNAIDTKGRLVTCEHATRRVTRTEADGTITVLADRFQGARFNSPNDLIVLRDGTVLFTDPDYALLSRLYTIEGTHEIGANHVYRIDPKSGAVTILLADFDKPNGLAVSPDETLLYVADSGRTHRLNGPHHVRTFSLSPRYEPMECGPTIVIAPGVPDGLKIDSLGNLWISAHDGVHCHAPDGRFLGKIDVPEIVANLAFGGDGGNTLFIAASASVYAKDLKVRGAGWS
jgi:gluconolactonase